MFKTFFAATVAKRAKRDLETVQRHRYEAVEAAEWNTFLVAYYTAREARLQALLNPPAGAAVATFPPLHSVGDPQ